MEQVGRFFIPWLWVLLLWLPGVGVGGLVILDRWTVDLSKSCCVSSMSVLVRVSVGWVEPVVYPFDVALVAFTCCAFTSSDPVH